MAWSQNIKSAAFASASSQSFTRTNDVYDLPTATLECWVKHTTLPSSAAMAYIDTNQAGGGYILGCQDVGAGVVKFYFALNGGTGYIMTSTTVLSTGVWYHVAVAWNTSSAELIINGISEATDSGAQTISAGVSFQVGKDNVGGARYFMNGSIDDVRIWNVKRTAAQVLALKGVELAGTESGLLSYWKFDESSGNAADSTSGARTLTNNNTVTYTADLPFAAISNSFSETLGTPVETLSSSTSISFSVGDVLGAPVEVEVFKFAFGGQSKSSTGTWSAQSKS